jgi:C-terminal processing protease CtpA/Prc
LVSVLGLKIVGGRTNPFINQLSAYITSVKKGSAADTSGRLRPGDEILKWNGKLLRGLNGVQVNNIIAQTKSDTQVELVVERPVELVLKKIKFIRKIKLN